MLILCEYHAYTTIQYYIMRKICIYTKFELSTIIYVVATIQGIWIEIGISCKRSILWSTTIMKIHQQRSQLIVVNAIKHRYTTTTTLCS